MSNSAHSNRLLIGVLMLSLCFWGGMLSLGAYLYNFDARKAVIVSACVLAFLGLWAVVLFKAARRRQTDTASPAVDDRRQIPSATQTWSAACLLSFALSTFGVVIFSLFRFLVALENTSLDLTIKGVAVACMMLAIIIAMIGLSDPGSRRGKWLSIVGVLMIGALLIIWLSTLSPPAPEVVTSTKR